MINTKSILGIIPARGGSKGLKGKNIKILKGKPLIAWTIDEAKKSKYIDKLILSSEDEKIISTAKKFGCEVPFVRPKHLSKDDTPGVEPILHAAEYFKNQYEYICLLQPTSPLREFEDIDSCIEQCINQNSNSCVSVCEVDKHPYWMYLIDESSTLKQFVQSDNNLRRQDLPLCYALNGAVYFIKTTELLETKKLISNDTVAHIMNKENSVDIDDLNDFKFAEFLIEERQNNVS
jgi:CMP-N,N'-diacetyllegionaminic acid synthase